MGRRFLFFREFLMRQKNIMNSSKIVLRINAANPNHHLWNNNGTWWCHYTEHRPDFTKRRVRMSLQTPRLAAARVKRDRWFSEFARSPQRTTASEIA
jgi:hypothetical protein